MISVSDNRTSIHNHSYYSNLRLLDALPSPESIIDRALELNINMIGISEHESLSSHIKVNKYGLKLQEQYPDFKTMLCDEIYLLYSRYNRIS